MENQNQQKKYVTYSIRLTQEEHQWLKEMVKLFYVSGYITRPTIKDLFIFTLKNLQQSALKFLKEQQEKGYFKI
jgi:hypothetical protein